MAVGLYIDNRGIEHFSVTIERILPVVAVKGSKILFADTLGRTGKGFEITGSETVDKLVEDCFDRLRVPCNLIEGDGIGGVADKNFLVYI